MKITLNPDHALFQWLKDKKPIWWENLKNDPDLYIDIRKENYINVYYNGGSIMRLKGAKPHRAYIHVEYIPLFRDQDYCEYNLDNQNAFLDVPKPIKIDNFDDIPLSMIKKRIQKYYPNKSEKGIQGKYVTMNNSKVKGDGFFIDTEMQFRRARVDMTWVDIKTKTVVLVELKTIDDNRLEIDKEDNCGEIVDYKAMGEKLLYSKVGDKPEPIDKQLMKYYSFASKNKESIIDYYDRVLCIKRNLGILPSFVKLRSLKGYKLIEKPVLLVGDCSQIWIDENATKLNAKVKDLAFGCLYQGKGTMNFKIPYRNFKNCFRLADD